MIHSQTKVKYLNCPFVTRVEDLNETVYQNNSACDSKDLDRSTMFDLISRSVDASIINRYGNNYLSSIEKFLSDTTDKKYTKILYRVSHQDLSKADFITSNVESNPIINFVTTAYRDYVGSSIDREYSSTISWTVIPLSIDVAAEKIGFNNGPISSFDKFSDINVDINVDIKINNVAKILDPHTHTTDNECQKLESHIMMVRSSRRGTIHRDTIVNTEKKDTFSDSLSYESSYKPNFNHIQLDGNTRSSAHIIRERLANPYKSYRLRNNPDAYKRSIKINRSIKNTDDNVINKSDNNIIEIVKSSGNYVQENVEIRRSDKILKFRPSTTGKILFDNETCIDKKNSKFLSVMWHDTILHITLHDLDWI